MEELSPECQLFLLDLHLEHTLDHFEKLGAFCLEDLGFCEDEDLDFLTSDEKQAFKAAVQDLKNDVCSQSVEDTKHTVANGEFSCLKKYLPLLRSYRAEKMVARPTKKRQPDAVYYRLPEEKKDIVQCAVCQVGFASSQALKLHLEVHRRHNFGVEKVNQQLKELDSIVISDALSKQTKSFSGIVNGEQITHGPPYKCSVCGHVCKRAPELKDHLRLHTGEKPHTCPHCDKSFRIKRSLTEHLRTHSGEKPFVCRFCAKPYKTRRQRKCHENTHMGIRPYKCDMCGHAFHNPVTLIAHKKHHCKVRKSKLGENVSKLPSRARKSAAVEKVADGDSGTKENAAATDIDTTSGSQQTAYASKESASATKETASAANKSASATKESAYATTETASATKETASSTKQSAYATKQNVSAYATSVSRSKQYATVKVVQTNNMQTAPDGESDKTAIEEISGTVLYSDTNANGGEKTDDVNIMKRAEKKSLLCSDCGKVFNNVTRLKSHMYSHTGAMPFKCPQCGQGFNEKKRMIEHVRIHTGEKPFQCRFCDKAYRVRNELKKHENVHTGEIKYTCEVCSQTFLWKKSYRTHLLIHSDAKPHTCQLCGAMFRHKVSLKNHMAQHDRGKTFSPQMAAQISMRTKSPRGRKVAANTREVTLSSQQGFKGENVATETVAKECNSVGVLGDGGIDQESGYGPNHQLTVMELPLYSARKSLYCSGEHTNVFENKHLNINSRLGPSNCVSYNVTDEQVKNSLRGENKSRTSENQASSSGKSGCSSSSCDKNEANHGDNSSYNQNQINLNSDCGNSNPPEVTSNMMTNIKTSEANGSLICTICGLSFHTEQDFSLHTMLHAKALGLI